MVGAPPLRTAQDQAALWDALRSGDLQAIGSDNTAWTSEQKAAGKDDFTRVPAASIGNRGGPEALARDF